MIEFLVCHATDDPPKIGPPGPSTENFAAIGSPPSHGWSPHKFCIHVLNTYHAMVKKTIFA